MYCDIIHRSMCTFLLYKTSSPSHTTMHTNILTIQNVHSTQAPPALMSHDDSGLFSQQHGVPMVLQEEIQGWRGGG